MNESPRQPLSHSRALVWGLPLCAAAIFVAQGFISMVQKGPTCDEVPHIAAAHEYISRGLYRFNPEHPPLAKQLAGLALLTLHLEGFEPEPLPHDVTDPLKHWDEQQWICGTRLLLESPEADWRTILAVARLPLLLLSVPLLIVLFLWTRAMLGMTAAVVTLSLATFSPNLLAHARLLHTDFALTVFMTLTLAQAWRVRQHFTWPRALSLGLLCGGALCSKYSGALLAPILALIAVIDVARHVSSEPGMAGSAEHGVGRVRLLGEWALVGVVTAAVAMVMIVFCTWRFDPGWWFHGKGVLFHNHMPGYHYYCAGDFSQQGFWYYYLLALALKVPVGALLLVLVGFATLWRLDPKRRWDVLIFLGVPMVVFHVIAASVGVQIGVRHVLPTLPLLFMIGGAGAQWLWTQGNGGRGAVIIGVAAHAVASLVVAPDYISQFNILAGGPRHGNLWLDDSNVEWGQDLPALERWHAETIAREPSAEIFLDHFLSIPPEIWSEEMTPPAQVPGVMWLLLPSWDHCAISSHMLLRERLASEGVYGVAFPWDAEWPSNGWIRNSYLTFTIREAGDGSGDVVIDGPGPVRIPRGEWLAWGRQNSEAIAADLMGSRIPDFNALVQLRWQTARFLSRWADDEQSARAWVTLDELLRSLLTRANQTPADLPASLRRDMREHLAAQGLMNRSEFYHD